MGRNRVIWAIRKAAVCSCYHCNVVTGDETMWKQGRGLIGHHIITTMCEPVFHLWHVNMEVVKNSTERKGEANSTGKQKEGRWLQQWPSLFQLIVFFGQQELKSLISLPPFLLLSRELAQSQTSFKWDCPLGKVG